jgi:hypothetical protein
VEDAVHGNLYGTVVGIDGSRVVRATGWAERLSGSEQGFDGFVAKHYEGGHRAKPSRGCLAAARAADPLYDGFAAEFLEIIGGVAGAVLKRALFAEQAHPRGEVGEVKPLAEGDKAISAWMT